MKTKKFFVPQASSHTIPPQLVEAINRLDGKLMEIEDAVAILSEKACGRIIDRPEYGFISLEKDNMSTRLIRYTDLDQVITNPLMTGSGPIASPSIECGFMLK